MCMGTGGRDGEEKEKEKGTLGTMSAERDAQEGNSLQEIQTPAGCAYNHI